MANILQIYKYLLENEFLNYDSIYVDIEAKELFELLFDTTNKFKYMTFIGNEKYNQNSIFIIKPVFIKMDNLCRKIIEHNITDSKIISFPMSVMNWEYIFENYGITNFVEYKYLPIGFYPINNDGNLMSISWNSPKIIENAMQLTDTKYKIIHIGNKNINLTDIYDNNSKNLLIVFNRYYDILSVININLSFKGYIYELFGYEMINELKDNRLYKRIKNFDMITAIVEIKTEGKRLQVFKSWLDEYYHSDKDKNVIIECKDKLVHIKEKEEFEKIVQLSLDINRVFSSNPTLTKDQEYMLTYHKLVATNESVINDIIRLINNGYNIIKIFRLICIESLLLNGIMKKKLELIKNHIINIFGVQHIESFDNLIHLGLIKVKNILSLINIVDKPIKIKDIIAKYKLDNLYDNISILFDGGVTLEEINDLHNLDKKIHIYFSKIVYPNEFIYECMKN